MLITIAYLYEDFPKYDRVEQKGNKVKYFNEGHEVFSEDYNPALVQIFCRQRFLGLTFVHAETIKLAIQQFIASFPQHIITLTASPVPVRSNP